MNKYVYVRRLSDRKVLDIPEEQLAITLKRGGFETVSDISVINAPVVLKSKTNFNPLKCIFCGFISETSEGLAEHKKEVHK